MSPTSMSTFRLSPLSAIPSSSSKLDAEVSRRPRPQKVAPPKLVPDTLSYVPSPTTLTRETPLPTLTSKYGYMSFLSSPIDGRAGSVSKSTSTGCFSIFSTQNMDSGISVIKKVAPFTAADISSMRTTSTPSLSSTILPSLYAPPPVSATFPSLSPPAPAFTLARLCEMISHTRSTSWLSHLTKFSLPPPSESAFTKGSLSEEDESS
mmetsp:Transcript_20178/g.51520  ORF Transcript_20178/g.51520 Transcript_20178/m.51520 type:complete len:207 (+) Transcript_20178:1815-2435(+)